MPMIEVSRVIVRNRHRRVDGKKVEQLSKSIEQSGLINPVIIAGDVLVAGAHRLAAFKLLGREVIPFASMGSIEDSDTCELIEIDENLFRNELSESERSEHLARRIDIIAKRNIGNEIVKVAGKPNGNGKALSDKSANELAEMSNKNHEDMRKVDANNHDIELTKMQQKVLKTATANALAEAKKEVAEITGKSTVEINKAIKNHEAVTNAGLDRNKLEELNGVQYKRVADVAKKQGKEAAEVELEIQLTKKQGSNDSVINHDIAAKLKQDISVIRSARSCIKRALEHLDSEEKAEEFKAVIDGMSAVADELVRITNQ